MQNCVNDFSPLIVAVAGVITVQFPVIIGLFVNQQKIKKDVRISKGLNYSNDSKMDMQTSMINNGFNPEESANPANYKELVGSGK